MFLPILEGDSRNHMKRYYVRYILYKHSLIFFWLSNETP